MIKTRKEKEFNDTPTSIDLERSILDVRKAYSSGSDEDFARMYRRRYRVSEAVVMKVLGDRTMILEARAALPGLQVDEFVEKTSKALRIKPALVRTVLEMSGKG